LAWTSFHYLKNSLATVAALTERVLMPTIDDIATFLDEFAPSRLAEDWDNVGLLTGDRRTPVERIMTCLTITPESAAEAIANSVQLIVTHHPLPFHAIKRITTDTVPGKLLWELIRAGVAIYSPHTGFDSAGEGINQNLARRLSLASIEPLQVNSGDLNGLGAGRMGTLKDANLRFVINRLKQEFNLIQLQYVGELDQTCQRLAVACGSGGSFLAAAIARGCDTFVTGEASFHTCLEAKANGVALILLGHYSSERFGVEQLAHRLKKKFSEIQTWCSRHESDPISVA
jgi:dinuclear metal center YbgI/SA1388 family protein